jgi:hypothetical protein
MNLTMLALNEPQKQSISLFDWQPPRDDFLGRGREGGPSAPTKPLYPKRNATQTAFAVIPFPLFGFHPVNEFEKKID